MLRHLTSFCIVLGLSAATTRADDKPVPAETTARADDKTVGTEIQQLKGKVVKIYHDVDLLGAGKPSRLHTEYLTMVLGQAGVTVVRNRPDEKKDEKKPDVVILGDITAPPQLDPAEVADPFMAAMANRRRQEIQRYKEARPKLEKEAAAAGSRVIKSDDVAAALGIRVTEAQIVEVLDARAWESLDRAIPVFKANALSLRDIVDFLRDVSGANIFVNWRALEAAGVDRNAPLTLNVGQTPLSEALDKLLAQAGGEDAKLGYAVRAGVIVISTDDDLKQQNR
jgi:hypothetical protein